MKQSTEVGAMIPGLLPKEEWMEGGDSSWASLVYTVSNNCLTQGGGTPPIYPLITTYPPSDKKEIWIQCFFLTT